MNHADHVALLAGGVRQDEGGTWADLGAGTGAFTLALADLIGPHGVIHAVDRDRAALAELRAAFVSALPRAELHARVGDFTRRLDLSDLDGVVMANSLHFVTHGRGPLPGASQRVPRPPRNLRRTMTTSDKESRA